MSDVPKTLLRAAWIAPMDQPPIREGAVVFAGDTILDVGDVQTLSSKHAGAVDQDLGDVVVLPGLINAHVHLELSNVEQLKGVSRSSLPLPSGERRGEGGQSDQYALLDREAALTLTLSRRERGQEGTSLEEGWHGSLADWLIEVIKRSPQGADESRIAHAIHIGVEQCLRFGVTTVGDISRQAFLTRPLLRKGPLRVVSFGEIQAMAGRRHLLGERLAGAMDRSQESERFITGLSPHAPYSVEAEGYRRCVELAQSMGMPLSTHLAESADEASFLENHTGPFSRIWAFLNAWDDHVPRFAGGPIRFAQSVGLLGVPTVLAHVNYCNDEELKLLAAGRASVVYCPRTHAYFGHPPHRWRDMLAAGVNVAVGTDSLASSPDSNLVDDLRLLCRLAPDVPPIELWQLATTRAARALGMESMVGSLTLGKRADLVCFPVAGNGDPLASVLNEDVLPSHRWIGGKWIEMPGPLPQAPANQSTGA